MSFFDCENWNLGKMRSLMNKILKKFGNFPGISRPFCYIGKQFTVSPLHYEDGAFASGNFLHAGAPKYWLIVPLTEKAKFEK
jgi:hypothetical protein